MRLIARSPVLALLAAGVLVCCAVVAQSQNKDRKLDTAGLLDAPNVPLMVDSDGTLHFGPRTVPLPALASPEARQAYARQMLQRARTSAGRGGLASVRVGEVTEAPAPGGSKETALKLLDRPIPTVMRPNHFIYVRDDAPDGFAYAVAKALAEHRQLFQVQLEPWYYDPDTVPHYGSTRPSYGSSHSGDRPIMKPVQPGPDDGTR